MVKRGFDILIAFGAMVILFPFFIVIALFVFKNLGSPIFFRQPRPGKNGEIFSMLKFRSMTTKRDILGQLLPDEKRLTSFGRYLRASSLDELPNLWNVFIGKMSLVGPRPLLVEYLPLYNDKQARRHNVRPGITGLSQVSGRNSLTWKAKFDLDVWYIENRSFILDLKILWLTIDKVIRKKNINENGQATMSKFTGNE